MKLADIMRLIPYGETTIRVTEKLTDKKGLYLGTRKAFLGKAHDYMLLGADSTALDPLEVLSIEVADNELIITVEDKERCKLI